MRIYVCLCMLFTYILLSYGCNDSKETYNLDQIQQTKKIENHDAQIMLNNAPKQEIPQEVQDFREKYHNYIHKQGTKAIRASKEVKSLDKTFVMLRKTYQSNDKAMETLEEFACLMPDCSATKHNGIYRYSNMSIQDAYNAILMDKKTQIFTYFDIMKYYSYLLTSIQTTSIDLQIQYPKKTPFQTLKFSWSDDKLEVILIPKAEICKPYIYTYKITFIQDSKDVLVKKQEDRLSAFSYPSDLVEFVAKSCACARANGYIANLTNEELKVSKNTLLPNKTYCNDIAAKRASLWDKYMQDSRIIGILQHEQRLYPSNDI